MKTDNEELKPFVEYWNRRNLRVEYNKYYAENLVKLIEINDGGI